MYEKKRAINTFSIIGALTTFASTFFQNSSIFSKIFLLSGNLPFRPYYLRRSSPHQGDLSFERLADGRDNPGAEISPNGLKNGHSTEFRGR